LGFITTINGGVAFAGDKVSKEFVKLLCDNVEKFVEDKFPRTYGNYLLEF